MTTSSEKLAKAVEETFGSNIPTASSCSPAPAGSEVRREDAEFWRSIETAREILFDEDSPHFFYDQSDWKKLFIARSMFEQLEEIAKRFVSVHEAHFGCEPRIEYPNPGHHAPPQSGGSVDGVVQIQNREK